MDTFRGVLDPQIEAIGKTIVNCIYRVHRKLGAGLLESLYETCLEHELRKAGLRVQRQLWVPVRYDDLVVENALKIDLLVDDMVIIEVKAVEQVLEVHKAQLLTYMKLTGKQLGYLVNFNVPTIK